MTQEELLVSPETFKTLEMLLDNQTRGLPKVMINNAKNHNGYFGFKIGNHAVIIKNKNSIKNSQWYIHTEPGQEKMIIMVVDSEKQLFSGWDCKGKFFSKEWLFLGDRFLHIEPSTAINLIHNKKYNFDLVREELKDIYTEEYQEKNERIIVDEFLTENPFVGHRVQFKSKNNVYPEIHGNIYKLPSGDTCMSIYKNKNTVELIPGNTTQKIELKPGDVIEFVRKQNIFK